MKIIIMRHAGALSKQAAAAKFDADRPLSTVGREQARRAGDMLKHLGCVPTPIVCSPFVRTQETASLVNERLPAPVPLLPLTILAPGSGPDDLLRAVLNHANPTENWVLAVMHEPDVSYVLSAWLYDGEGYPFAVETGDLFALKVHIGQGRSSAKLLCYYSPSEMIQG